MIKDFDQLKQQLKELSTVLNDFNSEAVQLRILERLLEGSFDMEATPSLPRKRAAKKKSAARRKATSRKKASPKKKGVARPAGSATVLNRLMEEGFFGSRRTMKAIIEHSAHKKAHRLKANQLSGTLNRFVKDGRLQRSKNKDGQYEYYK